VPPTVSFVSPANGSQIVEGLRLSIEAAAQDNVHVSSVAFRVGNTLVATMPAAPYQFSYLVPRGSKGQSLQISATATDTSGNQTTRSVNVLVIADDPPAVTLIPPAKMVAGLPVA